jgi:hypothetical protein
VRIPHSSQGTLPKIFPSGISVPIVKKSFVSLDGIWCFDEVEVRREKADSGGQSDGQWTMDRIPPFRWVSKEHNLCPCWIRQDRRNLVCRFVLEYAGSQFVVRRPKPKRISRDPINQLTENEEQTRGNPFEITTNLFELSRHHFFNRTKQKFQFFVADQVAKILSSQITSHNSLHRT